MDPGDTTALDEDLVLSATEGRVVGCLIEKQATVPDSYPMTLNGLRTGCNQSSNRDPVVSYDEGEVLRALDSLKARRLVRFVHASHGARTTKYRQVLDETLGLESDELAVLSVLLLRGPQTPAEVRARTERQHAFAGVGDVETTLGRLADRPAPLVRHLGREAGRREARWVQVLTGEPDLTALAVQGSGDARLARQPGAAELASAQQAEELAALRTEVAVLRERFDELCRRLGEPI